MRDILLARMTDRGRVDTRAAVVLAGLALVVLLTYARLYFGIDFTDESFYVAVPYRFATGARPFVDDTSVTQPASALVYPFIKLYVALFGSEGLVLFVRNLHFAFTGAIGVSLYLGIRSVVADVWFAMLAAAAAVAVVPFGIHSLSYNTLGSGFLAGGMFLGLAWLSRRRRPYLVASGAALGLSAFAYPPLLVAVCCWFAALYLSFTPRSLRALRSGLLPAAVCALAAIGFYLQDGISGIRAALAQARDVGSQDSGSQKLGHILDSVSASFTLKTSVAVVVALLVLALASRRQTWAVLLLVPLSVLALPTGRTHDDAVATQFVTNFALFGPIAFLTVWRDNAARRVFGLVWCPSAIAAGVTALSSANGGINAGIGFFPASVATLVLIALALRGCTAGLGPTVRAWLPLLPGGVLLATAVALQYTSVYRDAPIRSLTAMVPSGAYAGLLTTPERRSFIQTLESDLQELWAQNAESCSTRTSRADISCTPGSP